MVVLCVLAVESCFQHSQAGRAGHLRVNHGNQLIPAVEAFAVLVCLVGLYDPVKCTSWKCFHYLLESAYPIHVAVSVVELALWVLSHSTLYCNALNALHKIYSGQ